MLQYKLARLIQHRGIVSGSFSSQMDMFGMFAESYERNLKLEGIRSKIKSYVEERKKLKFYEDRFADKYRKSIERKGRALLRQGSLINWSERCNITGETDSLLIKNSHILNIKQSCGDEWYDLDNCIILSQEFDTLFDKGKISFTDEGAVIYSDTLGFETIRRMKARVVSKLHLNAQARAYLSRHRLIHGYMSMQSNTRISGTDKCMAA